MNTIVLVFAILITIAYLCFSIWNVFITKKQIMMSVIDMAYCIVLGGFNSMLPSTKLVVITTVLLTIWLIIIGNACEKNRKKQSKTKAT